MKRKFKQEREVVRVVKKKKNAQWIEVPDVRLNPSDDCELARIWVHWNGLLEQPDAKSPPFRISLTGPRISQQDMDESTHAADCTCKEACGDWRDYKRADDDEKFKLHQRDSEGKWADDETEYKIDPWYTHWAMRTIPKDMIYWLRYTTEQVFNAIRNGMPVFISSGPINIICDYVNDRPMMPLAYLRLPKRPEPIAECIMVPMGFDGEDEDETDYTEDIVSSSDWVVHFDPTVLINIEKS